MHADHPFTAAHSPRLFLTTEGRRQALDRLDGALGARKPFLVVTGAPGTGKTALLREAIARWGERAAVATLPNPGLTRTELLEEIARRFRVDPPADATKPQLLASLERVFAALAGRRRVPVIVIEDAHRLDPGTLEELRLLASAESQGGRPFEVVLVGPPELEARLADPAVAEVLQRVSVRCRLEPLSHRETRAYLHHRVAAAGSDGPRLFPRKTCSDIHDRTRGVPRAINTLAAEALRRAREAHAESVTHEHVQAAAQALGPSASATPATAPPGSKRRPPAAATPPAADSHGQAEPPASERSFDPRVREWVTRFVGEQGPPRIGASIGFDERLEGGGADLADDAVIGAPATPGRKLVVCEDLDDWAASVPRIGMVSRPRAPSKRTWSVTGLAVSAAMAALVAVAVAVVMPQGRKLLGRYAIASFASHPTLAPAPPDVIPPEVRAVSSPPAQPQRVVEPAPASQPSTDSVATAPRKQRLAIDVASYLAPDRAAEERDRLATETGLQGWVLDDPDGTYRIVLGTFSTPERAESVASALLSRGLVSQALVIPLPPKRLRH